MDHHQQEKKINETNEILRNEVNKRIMGYSWGQFRCYVITLSWLRVLKTVDVVAF